MHAIAAGRPSYVSGIKSAGDSLNMKSHDLIIRNLCFVGSLLFIHLYHQHPSHPVLHLFFIHFSFRIHLVGRPVYPMQSIKHCQPSLLLQLLSLVIFVMRCYAIERFLLLHLVSHYHPLYVLYPYYRRYRPIWWRFIRNPLLWCYAMFR